MTKKNTTAPAGAAIRQAQFPEKAGAGGVRMPVLKGEIAGLKSALFTLPAGGRLEFEGRPGQGVFLFFTRGAGSAQTGGRRWDVKEIALLIPRLGEAVAVEAAADLRGLELVMDLVPADQDDLRARNTLFPYFMPYSSCKTYQEVIKSPKTINRTLLPEDVFPRFCAGSVQTTGPDRVGEHAHPMLEQLFLGLPGNQCTVKADAAETPFSEADVLHIPLGSTHSVRVDPGSELHYIWLDFFGKREDMSWITQQHIASDAKKP